MRWPRKFYLRLRSLVRHSSVERELQTELQFHLEQQIRENTAAGMTAEEARLAAIQTIGGFDQIKEECRDTRRVGLIEEFVRNLRYAARNMAKHRGLSAVAILTLALGIGANTAVFSLMYTLVLQPVSYPASDRLVVLETTMTSVERSFTMAWSYPKFQELRRDTNSFDGIAGYFPRTVTLTEAGEPERVRAELVSTNYFNVLRVPAAHGRTLLPDDESGADGVAVISEELWKRRFGADPAAIGSTIRLNEIAVTIVGVAPASFRGESGGAELWIPIAMEPIVPAERCRRLYGRFARHSIYRSSCTAVPGRVVR